MVKGQALFVGVFLATILMLIRPAAAEGIKPSSVEALMKHLERVKAHVKVEDELDLAPLVAALVVLDMAKKGDVSTVERIRQMLTEEGLAKEPELKEVLERYGIVLGDYPHRQILYVILAYTVGDARKAVEYFNDIDKLEGIEIANPAERLAYVLGRARHGFIGDRPKPYQYYVDLAKQEIEKTPTNYVGAYVAAIVVMGGATGDGGVPFYKLVADFERLGLATGYGRVPLAQTGLKADGTEIVALGYARSLEKFKLVKGIIDDLGDTAPPPSHKFLYIALARLDS